jgi:hypothetical protein
MVALLLAHGADVNWATTKGGCTPLHVAVQNGNMDIFTMLVEHGAGIDSPDGKGWTPLHHACVEGRRAMAEVLLGLGARMDAQTRVTDALKRSMRYAIFYLFVGHCFVHTKSDPMRDSLPRSLSLSLAGVYVGTTCATGWTARCTSRCTTAAATSWTS